MDINVKKFLLRNLRKKDEWYVAHIVRTAIARSYPQDITKIFGVAISMSIASIFGLMTVGRIAFL